MAGDLLAAFERARAAWPGETAEAPPVVGPTVDVADAQVRRRWADRLVTESGLPAGMLERARWDAVGGDEAEQQRVTAQAARWLARPERTLVLLGAIGVGKTMLAALLLDRLAEQLAGTWGRLAWLHSQDLFDLLAKDDADRRFTRARWLFVDDLGAESAKPWARGPFEALINDRWSRRRPMVITTNLHGEGALVERYGAPTVSRLLDRDWCGVIKFGGTTDRRDAEGRARWREP